MFRAENLRTTLTRVPVGERDTWLDSFLGIDALADDGADLPRGCVPYLPAPVDVLLRFAELAEIRASDVFIDVGSGVGRALLFMHQLAGAKGIGIEVQPELVRAANDLAKRLGSDVSTVHGDANDLAHVLRKGTVFFFYSPFSGERLARLLVELEAIARRHPIRVGCVQMPLWECTWLERMTAPDDELAVYRSR